MEKTTTIENVIKAYYRGRPDGHWFDKGTLRFFGCRLPQRAFIAENGARYFVTSEDNWDRTARLYTVRVQGLDGDMDTVGQFQCYSDRASATRLAKRLAECRLIG
jgi:hypothetical protein